MTSWIRPARLEAAASHDGFLHERQAEAGFDRDEGQDQPAIDRERREGGGPEAPAHVEKRRADGGEGHAQDDGKGEARVERHQRQRSVVAKTRREEKREKARPDLHEARQREEREPEDARARRRRSRRPRPAPGGSGPARAPG